LLRKSRQKLKYQKNFRKQRSAVRTIRTVNHYAASQAERSVQLSAQSRPGFVNKEANGSNGDDRERYRGSSHTRGLCPNPGRGADLDAAGQSANGGAFRKAAALVDDAGDTCRLFSQRGSGGRFRAAFAAFRQYGREPQSCQPKYRCSLHEMRQYGIVSHMADCGGKRYRRLEPSQNTLAMSLQWLAVHLATLDELDGGGRSAALRKQPSRFGAIQPLIADGLLASRAIRRSTENFSLLKWIDDGGIVMDRLIIGCPQDPVGLERIPTDVMSVSGLARRLNLSRSQLSRKFAIVEAMGSLGWSGARGQSALWVSAEFWRAYHAAQAEKLSIIDAAVAAIFEDNMTNRNFQARVSQPVLSIAAVGGRNF
jgi:hypothetical protein